ncbi:hypothetical protein ACFWPP_05480 [Streptomyces anulatus]|uniref:hypothetical protein n=1 Tax=Streptomyces anulatus TaxID=1892 RepID=UPI003667467C
MRAALPSAPWGEAVVPTAFLAATGTRIGDTVTLNGLAEPVPVRIVGEVLDPRKEGKQVFTDASHLTSAHPDLTETSHHIAVEPGTDVTRYVESLNRDLARHSAARSSPSSVRCCRPAGPPGPAPPRRCAPNRRRCPWLVRPVRPAVAA